MPTSVQVSNNNMFKLDSKEARLFQTIVKNSGVKADVIQSKKGRNKRRFKGAPLVSIGLSLMKDYQDDWDYELNESKGAAQVHHEDPMEESTAATEQEVTPRAPEETLTPAATEESQLNQILNEKDCSLLQQENTALLIELENLRNECDSLKSEMTEEEAVLVQATQEEEKLHAEASKTIVQLKVLVQNERTMREEAESSLAQIINQVETLSKNLENVQKDHLTEKCQFETERSRFLAEHEETISSLKRTIATVLEETQEERSRWIQEKSQLLQTVGDMQIEQELMTAAYMEATKQLEDKLKALEKKNKKKSFWKRITKFFRRS